MKTTTINDIREAIKDSIEQDAVHGSAIHWDFGKDSDGDDRYFVNWGDGGQYTLIGRDYTAYYEIRDPETNESILFHLDHTESRPDRWTDEGEPSFTSEGLETLSCDFITMIDNPEYDLYSKIWEKHDDGSYCMTPEAVTDLTRRESIRQLRNSRPTSMPLISDMLVSTLPQIGLSAKHLLPKEETKND